MNDKLVFIYIGTKFKTACKIVQLFRLFNIALIVLLAWACLQEASRVESSNSNTENCNNLTDMKSEHRVFINLRMHLIL